MSKIELRLSDVEPPEPDPKRTIYRDIANLPDPVKLGLTVRYFNHDDVDLYFQITGEADGYTFNTVNLGLLASGANAYKNLDEFASRAKPSEAELTNGEMEETIKLILKAYTDSGYTDLKWTYERTVTVHWINSADPSFTVDELDNFDDGTVQNWAIENLGGYSPVYLDVASDYVLSPPYSLKAYPQHYTSGQRNTFRVYKSFTTPNKDKVFAIFDLRLSETKTDENFVKVVRIRRDESILVHLGKDDTSYGVHNVPINKWIRIVVPLPKNATLTLDIWVRTYCISAGTGIQSLLWLDDFKIISK